MIKFNLPSVHLFVKLIFLLLFIVISLSNQTKAQTITIYASPNGVDTGIGFNTITSVNLKRAVLVAKSFPSDTVTILLMDGIYAQLSLDSTNNRNSTAPVFYRAINRGKAIFQVLTNISTTAFQPIPDSIVQRIVDSTAKTKVMQLPLASYKLKNMNVWPNTFSLSALTSPKFYNNGVPLPMSRYPKDSAMTMKKVLNNGISGKQPGGTFIYRDTTRFKYWLKAINDDGLYLSGAWRVPWQIDVVKTKFVDTLADTLQQAIGISGGLGDKYTRPYGNGKEPYWAINLVEEISVPGEWSINFRTKMLYMWLPDSAQLQVASDPTQSAISLSGINNTTFQGIVMDGGAGDGFTLNNCNNITIAGCDIYNCSGNGITITGGKNCTIQSNDIHHMGGNAIKIASANYLSDQKNVVLCNHRVVNNHLYTLATEKQVYYCGVDMSTAIGAYIGYNLMHDIPQIAVYFGGNSNKMEYNEVYDAQTKYGGAAVFYRTGNFADRGNVLQYNYVHDSPLGGGLSEDNNGTGDSMTYNILTTLALGTNNNGGYADAFTNNIYANITTAHSSAITKDTSATYIKNYQNLQTIYNASAAYRAAYPSVAAMLDTAKKANKAFTSLEWDQFDCGVFINNSIAFGGIKDTAFFNTNGTQKTSATLATATAFKTYGTVVHNNYKYTGKLPTTPIPFDMNWLKSLGAFDRTCGKDWHINRIGLYKDAYRTTIDSNFTKGISPTITWQQDSINGDTVIVRAIITNPNIANNISSIQFYLDSSAATPAGITQTSLSYDTLLISATFTKLPAGSHAIGLTIFDAPNWQYNSALDTFSILKTLPVQTMKLVGKANGCQANLIWTAVNGSNINQYEVQQSVDGINFKTINTVEAQHSSGTNNYGLNIHQSSLPITYYRLRMTTRSGEISFSNTVSLRINCLNALLTVFPNPAKTTLKVAYTSVIMQQTKLALIDVNGKEVFTQNYKVTEGNNNCQVNVAALPAGSYLLLLTNTDGLLAKKMIVVTK